MPKIPDLEYVGDAVAGTIYRLNDQPVLALDPVTLSESVIARGSFIVRYAIPMLTPPTQAVVPGLFFGERGGALVGRDGWDYMQDRFQLHPRADVIGLNLDGSRAEVWIRDLDFGAKVRVFAYSTPEAMLPLVELFGYIAGEGADVPDYVRRYLPTRSEH